MPKDAILFVVRGMSLKTEFRVGITRCAVTFGQDCKALLPKDCIHPLFLANFLRAKSPEILGLVDEASHGTGRLATEVLEELEVPLPPLPEPKAIADYGCPDYFFTEYFRVHETSRLDKHILRSITENDTNRPLFAQMIGESIPDLVRSLNWPQTTKKAGIKSLPHPI